MAQNVSASTLLDIQAKIASMYEGNTPSKFPYNDPVMSAKALFQNNRARIRQELIGSNDDPKDVIVRIHWLQRGSTTPTIDSATEPSLSCDLVSGQGPTSTRKNYSHNLWVGDTVEVNDDLYDNLYDFTELSAERLTKAMLTIRKTINTKSINFLDNNKTGVNNDSSLPSGVTFGSSTYTVDTSLIDLQSPRGFTDLNAIAQNNDLSDYFYLNGRYNFYNAFVDSDYRRQNDNEREFVRFDDEELFFDIRSLDSTLGGKNTFAVERGSYALWNFSSRPSTPVMIKDNTWEYTIEDPVMMIWENGRLRPLRYHVYYQKICNGANSYVGRRTFTHVWEVLFIGGIKEAPPSEDNHTGILKFKQA